MPRFFKWLIGAAGVAIIGIVFVAAGGYAALRSSVPAARGEASMAALHAPVRVVRDRHGIPHIEAGDRLDAYRALGFVHAQDRLWQMHVLRMIAQGRLSEMFGESTVDTDIFLKTIDLAGAAKASFHALSADGKAILEAYAGGVNAYLNRETSLFEASLPPEFLVLGVGAEIWEPWQSIALLKVMAVTLDSNLSEELSRFAFAARGLTPDEIDDLLPYSPRDNPPPLPDLRKLYEFPEPGADRADLRSDEDNIFGDGLAWDIGVTASNNWVVAGSRTESGHALLANDPHLGLAAPSVFYLAHLRFVHEGERRHVIGGSLPGTPLVLVGRNDSVAWGLTTTRLDSQDVFIERLNAGDASQYLTPQGWRPFEADEIEVKVKGKAPTTFTRRRTRHGPVLPGRYRGLADMLPDGHVAAVQWVALAHDDTTVDGALAIALARDIDGFFSAVRAVVAPMQSMAVADTDGNIGLVAPGRAPLRNSVNKIAGRAPAPGWLAEYDWQGTLAFEALPQIVNPASGALATANANWLPPGYNAHITYDWDEHFRQARVEALVVDAKRAHGPESMKAIQADTFSPALSEFRDEALAQLQQGAGQAPAMLDALAQWDGHMLADRPEPLILTAWWRHFQETLLTDDLGEDYRRLGKGYIAPVLNILRGKGRRDWCDVRDTQKVESCGATLSVALSKAIEELAAAQGGDWRAWRWGKAHLAFGEHRPFSSVPALSRFFSVLQESAGGSYTLLRGRTDFSENHPYYSVHASAYRAWYDLGDPDRSQFVISTGQSGHFLSKHYRDQAGIWAKVDYLPMTTRQQDYEAEAEGVWMFNPVQ